MKGRNGQGRQEGDNVGTRMKGKKRENGEDKKVTMSEGRLKGKGIGKTD